MSILMCTFTFKKIEVKTHSQLKFCVTNLRFTNKSSNISANFMCEFLPTLLNWDDHIQWICEDLNLDLQGFPWVGKNHVTYLNSMLYIVLSNQYGLPFGVVNCYNILTRLSFLYSNDISSYYDTWYNLVGKKAMMSVTNS